MKKKYTFFNRLKYAIKYIKNNRKRKKRRLKKWVKNALLLIFILIIVYLIFNRFSVKNIYVLDNEIHFVLSSGNKNIYCMLTDSDTTPTLDSELWVKAYDKECVFDYDSSKHNLYIKKKNNIIYNNKKSIVFNFKFDKEKQYLPSDNKYKINYTYDYIGKNPKITFVSSDTNVVKIENKNIITVDDGKAIISANYNNETTDMEIISTSLIVNKPKDYDFKKKFLPCEKYSSEENDLLDEILYTRVHDVGFKTRAAAVEAARFLTLEFPYRINYFNENGSMSETEINKIDGEGRYYHIGLYLNTNRYESIAKSSKEPKVWGCPLYSIYVDKTMDNGLDCSGFVTWALLNAGYDVGDIGSGYSENRDLTDISKQVANSTQLMESGKIKVGDLLHSNKLGGHIGMLIGMDDEYYYVAQAIWYDERGVVITKETKKSFLSEFPHIVLMDSYYEEDGNLTNMWY